jgi:hypothetical protein
MPGMRTTFCVVVLLGAVGCGGQVAEATGDESKGSHAEGGTVSNETGAPGSEAGTGSGSGPAFDSATNDTGTIECTMPGQGRPCVLCKNAWYCPGAAYPPCSMSNLHGVSCGSRPIPSCFACAANGMGVNWTCAPTLGWQLADYGVPCTP